MPVDFDGFVADAVSRGASNLGPCTPAETQHHLIQFNRSVDKLVATHGLDRIGQAIWYLYGCGSVASHDALDDSVSNDVELFCDSLMELYEVGFAKHCGDFAGHSDQARDSFATACYMFWDMDGGHEYLFFRDRPELFEYGVRLIDFGLGHQHAACQESFLHCLGHLTNERPLLADKKIADFLRRNDISPEIRHYAEQCRTGLIP